MQPADFYASLKQVGIEFFCGVPDSLLKDFCAYITDHVPASAHIITANEGNALALAAGHYLATEKPALVYMQNSGLGNIINPLLSLTDEEVYNIPALIVIGWRGEPNVKDEPQHIKQGKVTEDILDAVGIKYAVLPSSPSEADAAVKEAITYMETTKKPYAFIVRKNSFDSYTLINKKKAACKTCRETAVSIVAEAIEQNDIVVATTGQISRELYEYREAHHQDHAQDFLTVGSMGHASSIALGIALVKENRRVICFDGDGAFLMHMGALPVIASKHLKNFKHIVFNNEAHDSVGGQPTCADVADLTAIASACGYQKVISATTEEELKNILPEFLSYNGTAFLEIKVKCGARSDLGRPKEKPVENKIGFMKFLNAEKK